ncbi:MAG: methyltransferase domain-containing protein [Solidesulfovibrio sp. DCME]|uniref:class I SAM-dependent methyltransferase n=1 Tax=Solidesulfovibrio sp. DCME TaxID=3447380 RepID=UPI003D0D7887
MDEAKCRGWDVFEDDGVCRVCGQTAVFAPIRPGHSLRETRCSSCKASRRSRDLARVLAHLAAGPECRTLPEALPAMADWRVFEAQAAGPLHDRLRCLPRYVCSEYVPELAAPGACTQAGLRCEDLERLSFADAAFDLVVTQDVFEHVADPWQAFDEIWRVLAPGGRHVFTVPMHEGHATTTRVRYSGGTRQDVLPPVHHGDPVRQGGSLVVTDFGDDLRRLLTARGQPTIVAVHVAFYKPSEMPGIIEGDVHALYEAAYKAGEKASFLRYNSVVFVTQKPGAAA